MPQGCGCAQIAGNFKGFPKLIDFLFFELFEIEKMGFEWQCVFIEPSGTKLPVISLLPLVHGMKCPSLCLQVRMQKRGCPLSDNLVGNYRVIHAN